MLISQLEDRLRIIIRERISSGLLTGLQLAKLTGFQQAHISNFLGERRGLSVEGVDRLMQALQLQVEHLVGIPPAANDGPREYDDVPLVAASIAHHPDFVGGAVVDVLKFKRSFLRRIRHESHGRDGWERFVAIKADTDNALAMYPRILPNAVLLIDRHWNSPEPYRRREANVYAVRKGNALLVRYAESHDGHLLLRPANQNAALASIKIEGHKAVHDYIIGRVCYVGTEI